jgi:dipeptidyl aminopeptidase/acylaminoacyl peptidase
MAVLVLAAGPALAQDKLFTPADVARIRQVQAVEISPEGTHIAYLLGVPRRPFVDDDGPAYAELHVVEFPGPSSPIRPEPARPFISGPVNIANIAWTPGGDISFLAKRGEDKTKSLYVIPADGGEARKVLACDTDISGYSWSPDGAQVAVLATRKQPKDEKEQEDKGFKAVIYEEKLDPLRLWIGRPHLGDAAEFPKKPDHRELDLPGSAEAVRWSPDGRSLAVALTPRALIDDRYMRTQIHIVDAGSGSVTGKLDTTGKLGDFSWSPDSRSIAMIGAQDIHDPQEGRLLVADAGGGQTRDVLPGLQAHVTSICWQDDNHIMYLADQGVWTTLGKVSRGGSDHKTLLAPGSHVLGNLRLSRDGQRAALTGESPGHPPEVFTMRHGDSEPYRLTDSNPWLAGMRFSEQQIVTYPARDGLEIEAILTRPLDEQPGVRYPLIVYVHGGPEAHERQGWQTRYSQPGQVGAARGFAVLSPNYRGSTGRGVEFSKMGQADYGGKEFDDLLDGIDHLVKNGLVDGERVGITGGSYGGYASAWCATYHSERFKSSVMFVGMSDLVSKMGTTDIPDEMYLVHARKWPWEDPEFFRERSPLTHAQKCRTPILIMHGEEDPRVHPSQSLELYRYLKTLGQVPVRLVLYPGEGHGNRKAAARLDYNMRLMQWMEHYLNGPGGEPPPYELDYSAVKPPKDEEKKG